MSLNTATVEYTATDKKRVTVNGEVVAERGGKAIPARVKVAAFREVNLLKNDDGSLVRDENGRGVYGETGNIIYGVKFSNADAMRSEERRVGKECRSRWSPYH